MRTPTAWPLGSGDQDTSSNSPQHRKQPKTRSQIRSCRTATVSREATKERRPSVETAGPVDAMSALAQRGSVREARGPRHTREEQRPARCHHNPKGHGDRGGGVGAGKQPWRGSQEPCSTTTSTERRSRAQAVRVLHAPQRLVRETEPRVRDVSTLALLGTARHQPYAERGLSTKPPPDRRAVPASTSSVIHTDPTCAFDRESP